MPEGKGHRYTTPGSKQPPESTGGPPRTQHSLPKAGLHGHSTLCPRPGTVCVSVLRPSPPELDGPITETPGAAQPTRPDTLALSCPPLLLGARTRPQLPRADPVDGLPVSIRPAEAGTGWGAVDSDGRRSIRDHWPWLLSPPLPAEPRTFPEGADTRRGPLSGQGKGKTKNTRRRDPRGGSPSCGRRVPQGAAREPQHTPGGPGLFRGKLISADVSQLSLRCITE